MAPTIFDALAFRFAVKLFVARQFFLFKAATTSFDPHLKAL